MFTHVEFSRTGSPNWNFVADITPALPNQQFLLELIYTDNDLTAGTMTFSGSGFTVTPTSGSALTAGPWLITSTAGTAIRYTLNGAGPETGLGRVLMRVSALSAAYGGAGSAGTAQAVGTSGSSSGVPNLPAGLAAGDNLILMVTGNRLTGATGGFTVTGTTYNLLGSATGSVSGSGTSYDVYLYERTAGSSETAPTVTATIAYKSYAGASWRAIPYYYRGATSAVGGAATGHLDNPGGTLTSPTPGISGPGIEVASTQGVSTQPTPTGFTSRQFGTGFNFSGLYNPAAAWPASTITVPSGDALAVVVAAMTATYDRIFAGDQSFEPLTFVGEIGC